MRKLVTIRTINAIKPIDKADAIECVVIDGWEVVAKKGEFQVGDPCVYHEIDSFLPASDERYSFLAKGGVKKDPSGKERIRLKTIRLRGQLSQGLALPLTMFPELVECKVDEDVSEILDVIKYERPEPMTANARGNFPEFVVKTDEPRIQNVYYRYKQEYADECYYATMKLDGSSCTVVFLGEDMKDYWKNEPEYEVFSGDMKVGEVSVCSRNLELKYDANSHFWKAVSAGNMICKILNIAKDFGSSIAIQGEVMGPGIQGNKEKLNNYEFYAFNIFDIKGQHYLPYAETADYFEWHNVQAVPLITQTLIQPFKLFDLAGLLAYADGRSINAKYREGIVFKPANGGKSFKVISNKFLLKGGDE